MTFKVLAALIFSTSLLTRPDGISWKRYYANHAKEVNEAVATRKLDLTGKRLSDLVGFDQANIPGLNDLEVLRLDKNELTAIPATIGELKSLIVLRINHNLFTQLPNEIGDLISLQLLGLKHNRLTALPDSIEKLSALKKLHVSHNELVTLPPGIGKLEQLDLLDASFNQLTTLPDSFSNLHALKKLYLFGNQLRSLPSLAKLTNLELIWIENNPLPFTTQQIRTSLEIGENVDLKFRTEQQEKAIAELFAGIKETNEKSVAEAVATLLNPSKPADEIDMATIVDRDGNSLIQYLLLTAQKNTGIIAKKINRIAIELLPEETKDEIIARYTKELNAMNASYVDMLQSIRKCHQRCTQKMLYQKNSEGQSVLSIMQEVGAGKKLIETLYAFGPNNPLYKEISRLLATISPTQLFQTVKKR